MRHWKEGGRSLDTITDRSTESPRIAVDDKGWVVMAGGVSGR